MKNKELIRTIKFTLFSISAGIIQIGLFTLLNELLVGDYWVSYITSLVASILWNFTINRKITFKASNNVKLSMLLVFLFYLVFTPISTILGEMAENNGANEYLVLAITMLINFVLKYLYTRYFVYRNSCDTAVKKTKRSFWYSIIRFAVNIFYRKREFIGLENISDETAILVANHAQIHGPLVAEVQFPLKRKTWCIGNVMSTKEFIHHAKNDFWINKPKWIRWFFYILAYIIAPIGASVFKSADVIAVYKDSRLITTFKETVKELANGNHIIIFPESPENYNNIVNDFQDKFIDVARLYYKKYGKCLTFIPMYNAVRLKKVVIGKGIKYDPNMQIEEMRKTICDYLKEQITNLALTLPPHEVVKYSNEGRKHNPISK